MRLVLTLAALFTSLGAHASLIDFESPTNFVNGGADVDASTPVAVQYGPQFAAGLFGIDVAQSGRVDTLLVGGTRAFGTGYSDPSGTGGNYALGLMQGGGALGLSFPIGKNGGGAFYDLYVRFDLSSIDLSGDGGPFLSPGDVPLLAVTLFDNPGGAPGVDGNGTILDSLLVAGVASPQDTFVWTPHPFISTSAGLSSDGNVTLQFRLLGGHYAALDNLDISVIVGDCFAATCPEPGTWWLLGVGALSLTGARRRVQGRPASDQTANIA